LRKYRVLFEAMKKAINIEIHEKKPEGFSPQVQVAACYLEIGSKLLLLQRDQQ
jgi:8-oxo-dGTP diphosphatase